MEEPSLLRPTEGESVPISPDHPTRVPMVSPEWTGEKLGGSGDNCNLNCVICIT